MVNACSNMETHLILTTYDSGKTPERLKAVIEESLDADKAANIETIDLRGQTAIADYMVVCTGTSTRAVAALAEKLEQRLKAIGHNHIRVEGKELANWVILDAGDVIVHIFRPEVREYYNIEKMWRAPHIVDSAHASRPA
jgi:ribosome-associated protein